MPLAFSPPFASERSVNLYIEINVESHGFALLRPCTSRRSLLPRTFGSEHTHTPAVTKTVFNYSHFKVYVKVYEGKHGYKPAG